MKNLSIGLMLLLWAGCAMPTTLKMDFASSLKEGDVHELMEISNPKAPGFTIQIWNLGPERAPGDPSILEIRDDDRVLGRIESGETATYTVPGGSVRLQVRGLRGDTRFKGCVDINSH